MFPFSSRQLFTNGFSGHSIGNTAEVEDLYFSASEGHSYNQYKQV